MQLRRFEILLHVVRVLEIVHVERVVIDGDQQVDESDEIIVPYLRLILADRKHRLRLLHHDLQLDGFVDHERGRSGIVGIVTSYRRFDVLLDALVHRCTESESIGRVEVESRLESVYVT